MPTNDEKRRQEFEEHKDRKGKDAFPVVEDIKDDMHDPVKGLPKGRA